LDKFASLLQLAAAALKRCPIEVAKLLCIGQFQTVAPASRHAPVTTGEARFKAGQFESEDWRR